MTAPSILILHAIVGLEQGGAELFLERLLLSRKNAKNEKHIVVSLTRLGPIGLRLQKAGFVIYSLSISSFISALVSVLRLINILKRENPCIIQTWMYHADFFVGIVSYILGYKNIVWGIRTTYLPKKGVSKTALLRSFCSVLSYFVPRKIIVAGVASKDYHVKKLYSKDKMCVIPNGYKIPCDSNLKKWRVQARFDLGLSQGDTLVGAVGRFTPEKDYSNLLQSYRIVLNKYPKLKFLIIGKGIKWNNLEFRSLIELAGISESLILIDEVENIFLYYSAMDVFVLGSKTEGFPNVLAEAMSAGIPCVSTNVGDAKFILGDAGVLTAKESPCSLATGLISILDLPVDQRIKMGIQGSTRIKNHFSIENSAKQYLSAYRQILADL